MQLAPSLHRVGSSSLVNSYLVEDAGAITVIDAGLRGHWKDLLRELEAMGRSPVNIRALLLTDGDVDHVGFAERLRQEHGVPVFVGAPDAAQARGEVPKPAAARDRMRVAPMARFLVYGLTHRGLRSTPIKDVTPIAGATTLDVPGAPAVIPLPGHTAGSVAYHMASVDAIFMGDAMTTRSVTTGIVGPALGPFTVDPAKAVASLDALDGLSAHWVLPGHGDPWTAGLPEAVRLIRAAAETRSLTPEPPHRMGAGANVGPGVAGQDRSAPQTMRFLLDRQGRHRDRTLARGIGQAADRCWKSEHHRGRSHKPILHTDSWLGQMRNLVRAKHVSRLDGRDERR